MGRCACDYSVAADRDLSGAGIINRKACAGVFHRTSGNAHTAGALILYRYPGKSGAGFHCAAGHAYAAG
ncbi:hypothetical protein [Desulfosporosinus youngiae]|uniref:hypothetical protein n=1 Tax=Desulfosporosinus youngiae TaxID=339862 RepID=UPI001FA77021|nr:hypothetical protein [Desulfosporosinus youngiae]